MFLFQTLFKKSLWFPTSHLQSTKFKTEKKTATLPPNPSFKIFTAQLEVHPYFYIQKQQMLLPYPEPCQPTSNTWTSPHSRAGDECSAVLYQRATCHQGLEKSHKNQTLRNLTCLDIHIDDSKVHKAQTRLVSSTKHLLTTSTGM